MDYKTKLQDMLSVIIFAKSNLKYINKDNNPKMSKQKIQSVLDKVAEDVHCANALNKYQHHLISPVVSDTDNRVLCLVDVLHNWQIPKEIVFAVNDTLQKAILKLKKQI